MSGSRARPLGIGAMAERTGLAPSALRFYEEQGLLSPARTEGGHRQYSPADLRRASFVMAAQRLGVTLSRIRELLNSLPGGRAPTQRDWARLAARFDAELAERIAGLQALRARLSGCIGCGCLSLKSCKIHNPGDGAGRGGPGPRFVLGDSAEDLF